MSSRFTILFIASCITILSFSPNLSAQDTFFQEADEKTEAIARQLTQDYQVELVMTSDQTLLFEKKVAEFLIRKENIEQQKNLSVREKLRLLRKLSQQENAEMTNILTRPQLRRYKKVKKQLQPIQIVVGKVGNQS